MRGNHFWFSALLIIASTSANADTVDESVLRSAKNRQSESAIIDYNPASVVYVGRANDCDAVSIIDNTGSIRNFRVCNGIVKPRNTVSPSWDAESGRQTLLTVIQNSMNNGQSSQKDRNGYLITAHELSAASTIQCKKYEVVISYEDDLVDRDVVSNCKK